MKRLIMGSPNVKMNLGDPELEYIDPTPNVHTLFVHFDKLFFWSKLASRAVVRWSKRMYSCAGICSYEGKMGLCDIALSEPLLKLRSRKDLVETLLHEMIHAFLFITNRDRDRDGHGPNFQSHMHRINKLAGLNITIYHDFHEEVNLYLTHWWRCNGPCQKMKPFFGVVRRTCNRAPGPHDSWWKSHQRSCGGTFVKIKEPEKVNKKRGLSPTLNKKLTAISNYIANKTKQTSKTPTTPMANKKPVLNNNNKIDKYMVPTSNKQPKEVLKDTSNTLPNNNFANNNIVNKNIVKNNIVINNFRNNNLEYNNVRVGNNRDNNNLGNKAYIPIAKDLKDNGSNPPVIKQNVNTFTPPIVKTINSVFNHNGNLSNGRQRTQSANVAETVRNVWANKKIPIVPYSPINGNRQEIVDKNKITNMTNTNKKKLFTDDYPPYKIKKVEKDEELAKSVLKDIYGKDFNVSRANNKLVATEPFMVDCPICKVKIKADKINAHLDECLNIEVIQDMFKDHQSNKTHNTNLTIKPAVIAVNSSDKSKNRKSPLIKSNTISDFNGNKGQSFNIKFEKDEDLIDLPDVSFIKKETKHNINIPKHTSFDYNTPSTSKANTFVPVNVDNVKTTKEINRMPVKIKTEDDKAIEEQKCPCCDSVINKTMDQHLDECLAFFDNNTTIPQEGTSMNNTNNIITIDDDDDVFDESQTFNATGTKNPCPCCMQMVEQVDMNDHLDICLSS